MADDTEVVRKVRKWLTEQGYPLEMSVAQTMRKSGFDVIQAEYYRDPEVDAPREIDVVASVQTVGPGVLARVEFVIECKTSRDKPWVLFSSSAFRVARPASVAQRTASGTGPKALFDLANRTEVQDLSIFSLGENIGYHVAQAFGQNTDKAYVGLMSAANAAKAAARRADQRSSTDRRLVFFEFPVVVIDGILLHCVLEDDNDIRFRMISDGTVAWRNPVAEFPITLIRVLTVDGLREKAPLWAEGSAKFLASYMTKF